MSDIYDQSYNNPYHINRHSLGDQYRINLQNAPQNTSWFTGGSPSHNQRNGSILRDNGRFVIPSTYNQPRSQSYNKYNSKISETEYNSEYVPYSPEYYQPIKGLGRRLDIDRKQPFREEKINNGSFGEYSKYDIPPALMRKLKMLEKEYGNYEIENQEETEDEKSFEEEPDIVIPKPKPKIIKPKPKPKPKPVTPEKIHFDDINQDQEQIKVNIIPVVKNTNKKIKIVKPELIENVIGKDKPIVINKDSSEEKPYEVEMNENDEKPKTSEKPKEMQIPYTISKPIDKEKEEQDEDEFEAINEVEKDNEKQNQYEGTKPIKPKIEQEKPKPKIELQKEEPKPIIKEPIKEEIKPKIEPIKVEQKSEKKIEQPKIEEVKPKPKIEPPKEEPKPKIEPKPKKKFDPISAQYYDDSDSYLNRGIVMTEDNIVERAEYDDIEEESQIPPDEVEPNENVPPTEEEPPKIEEIPKNNDEEENITGIIPGIKDNNDNQGFEGNEIPLQEDQSVDLNRKHKVVTQIHDQNKKSEKKKR